ncbi:MAG: hypothetical protein B7Y43_17050 [Sphingomonas sp. 28-62-20]|uniref:hypothetical protein n=1 Tax=Sphingomonas sp. 28-62-20 TaxID=1970433 RepID=UPI000BDCBD10|nr:MAG: hypothetical protein B7Y43_17050 [Sphingomonas sp. 28-62-20]
MSVLEIPRIYYKGEISWDPVTTNNYAPTSAPAGYDENDCDSTLDQATVRAAQVANFRDAAVAEIVNSGNWNPAGSYRSSFFNSCITGVDTGGGLDTSDPFVNAPASFTGMLVDCEPYGALSSQLFFDGMSFGIAGGCRVAGKRVSRFSDRYINFSANPNNNMVAGVASVLWQTCFPKDAGLEIDAFDSVALMRLAQAMDNPNVLGVMTRFVTYRTVYYDDPTLSNGSAGSVTAGTTLQQKFAAKGFQPNPARSLLVGTIGLWMRDDPFHEPANRALLTTSVPITVSTNPKIGPAVCGTGWALVGEDRISLDLSNCIPWASRAPDKVDLGVLTLTAADPPPAVAIMEVAQIQPDQYDQAAYEATSGIIDIPLNPGTAELLKNMNLSLVGGDGTKYLDEAPLRAIPSEPNLYLNEGDTHITTVRVFGRGVPAGPGVKVTMSELGAGQNTGVTLSTDATGIVRFPLSATQGSVTGLVFQPGDNPKLPVTNRAFDTQTYTYMYLRVLPAEADIGAMDPTWDNVHNFVLSNWEAMAPCMDNWLLLGDEHQVKSYANVIRKLTDPANFELFRFMPVTRDMTIGQRTLLYNFLNDAIVTKAVVGASPGLMAKAEAGRDFDKLSRSMRAP